MKEVKKTVTTDLDNHKNETISMKKTDQKTIETLLKAKVTEGSNIDSAEQEKLVTDPKHVQMKKVEAQVLEKLAQMKITESSATETSIPAIPESETESTSSEVTTQANKVSRKSSIPEAEGLEDDEVEDHIGDELSTGLDDEPTSEPAPESTIPVTSTTEKVVTTTTSK